MSGSAEEADDLLPPLDDTGHEAPESPETPQDDGDEAPAPQQRPQRTVPLGEVQAERERRKEAEQRARALEETLARGNERLQQLLERQMAPQREPAPEVPSFDQDPAAHLRARSEQHERTLAQLAQREQQSAEYQQLAHAFNNAAAQVRQANPDFDAAYQYVWQTMQNEAAVTGINPVEIERNIVERAVRSGANPAQRIYELAKARGFTGKAPQQTPKAATEGRMDALERGATAARSLPSGGAAPRGPVTLETLANMSQEEFSEFSKRDPKAVTRILKGTH